MWGRQLWVLWVAPEDAVARLPEAATGRIRLDRVDRLARRSLDGLDLAVLDARAFRSLESMFEARLTLDLPVLYVVPAPQVGRTHGLLLDCDDLCEESASPELIAHRVVAHWRRCTSDQEVFASPLRDLLTGLQTLERFQREIEAAASAPSAARPTSMLWVNLHRFGKVNRDRGRLVGDHVLRCVGRRLRVLSRQRGACVPARVDGDEFALIAHFADAHAARHLAEQLQQAIARTAYRLGPCVAPVRLKASIGVATFTRPVEPKALTEAARRACRWARSNAPGTSVHVDDLGPDGRAAQDHDFLGELVRALNERVGDELAGFGERVVEEVGRKAETDALLQIPNRGYLDRRLPAEFADAAEERPLTLALIDVDHFGKVNKEYGWRTGDRTLQRIAAIIRDHLRETDWVARYGGEEIAVVFPGTTCDAARQILERVRNLIGAQPFRASDGRTFHVTISAGAAVTLTGDAVLDALWERVGDNLQYAKRNGRDQVVDDDTPRTGPGPS